MPPKGFNKFFWDINPQKIDFQKNSSYVAERLLELGDFEEIAWLLKTYGKEFLKRTVEKSCNLSLKSANFYSLYFGIDPKEVLCLRRGYRSKPRKIWCH